MVMKIYVAPDAGNCMRAILALFDAEVDVDKEVELVLVDLDKDDQKKPEYRKKNPLCLLPCLEDGDLIVFESRAIARYLAKKYKHQQQGFPLLGNTLKERATINQWCEVESQHFMPAVGPIFREEYLATRTSKKRELNEELINSCVPEVEKVSNIYVPDVEKVLNECVPKLKEVLIIYEAQLSTSKYIAGDEYTLADAFHIPYLYKLMKFKRELFGDRMHVIEWAESLINRPAFQETLKKDSMWPKE